MPPKKKGAPAKAKEPTPATPPRGADSVIANKDGREVKATAAAARPRRESAVPLTAPSIPAAKTTATTTKKRGRPAKVAVEEEPPAKRGRKAGAAAETEEAPKKRGPGRPPKKSTAAETVATATATAGKKRGRPSKVTTPAEDVDGEDEEVAEDEEGEEQAPPRKRGRPPKAVAPAVEDDAIAEDEKVEEQALPKKRGRPAKKPAPAVPTQTTAPPKRRGRPPKGGETTKIEADDEAAADQLEEELQDTAEDLQQNGRTSTRKAPASRMGKGAKGKAPVTQEDEDDDEAHEAEASEKNYWLMKAEQEDRDEVLANGERFNVKFTIDDLRAKTEPEPWDGVRNATAAKNMRQMKKGDLAFFYASGGKSGRKPGIVGIMEIVKEHEPDQTTSDPNAYGYVKDEKARARWCVVHVEYRNKLTKPVHLAELQKYSKDRGPLADMQEFNAARLSVSKVTEKEWDFITGLVEGYEDDEDAEEGPAPGRLSNNGEEELAEATTSGDGRQQQLTADTVTNGKILEESALPIAAAVKTTESTNTDLPSSDTVIPDGTSATSRPTSRAGSLRTSSRQASLAPPARSSSRPGSRAGRGRSKTPNPPAPVAPVDNTDESSATAALAAVAEEES